MITYDIDELLTKPYNIFYYEVSLAVPAYYSKHDSMLYLQERVIRDLWEFNCDTGCGFTSLIGNEHYDTVGRAYKALMEIPPSNCLLAVSELRKVLMKYGAPQDLDQARQYFSTFAEESGQVMDDEIEELDRRFFGGTKEEDVWQNIDYLEYGMAYAREHLDLLRQRKKG